MEDPLTFKAAWWLKHPHAQTSWQTLFRFPAPMKQLWERVELPDGDFLDLVWDQEHYSDKSQPIVVFLHGLGGNINSPYITGLMRSVSKKNFRACLMHFRGCSGTSNRSPRSYHAGETKDIAFIVNYLQERNPGVPIAAVGISVGSNVLLKWLGESGKENPLFAGVGVSVPFELSSSADRLMQGFSRIYQWWLLRTLKANIRKKSKAVQYPFDLKILDQITNFWEYDDKIVAPLNGFKDVFDYYKKCSCKQFLKDIAKPTLIIHSKDDPFFYPEVIPGQSELSASIQMNLFEKGGHAGFIEGTIPGIAHYWLEKKIPEFLTNYLSISKTAQHPPP